MLSRGVVGAVILGVFGVACSSQPLVESGETLVPTAKPPSTSAAGGPAPIPERIAEPVPQVDPAAYWYSGWTTRSGDAQGFFFQSPSGKWICAIVENFFDGTGAGCEAANSRTMSVAGAPLVPANDDRRNLVPPSSIVLKPGRPAEFVKLGQPYLVRPEDPTPVLEYGRELRGLGHTCNTAENGISCRNDQTGYGFTFSSKGYSFQYAPVDNTSSGQPPVPQHSTAVDDAVVLGASSDEYSAGYGTPRPAVISTNGLCGNTIEDVVWDTWGASVATGSGTWCQNSGSRSRGELPRPVRLVASDPADCAGTRAYRTLQFDDGPPIAICPG